MAEAKASETRTAKGAGEIDVPALKEANEKGYLGETLDPTPNHAYTVAGVGAGEATPETDTKAKAAAEKTRKEHEARLTATTG